MKKPVIVRIKDKKTGLARDYGNQYNRVQVINREQAATIEEPNHEIDTFAKKYDGNIKKMKNSNNRFQFRDFKPIIFASASAIVIGSILGIIMLKMFANIESEMTPSNHNPIVAADNNDKDKDKDKDNDKNKAKDNKSASRISLEPMHAFILQAGVFSAQANADEFAQGFKDEGISTIIWERDDQYFLLAGLTKTNEDAKNMANQFKEKQLEVYVKEWNVPGIEQELTNAEHDWFRSFHDVWGETLTAISNQEDIPTEKWNALLEGISEESKTVSKLIENIQPHLEELVKSEGPKAQHALLNIWNNYETVFK